jgi:4-amino-4-deoxy-L-arabinose transferase-like glycosyltransferase
MGLLLLSFGLHLWQIDARSIWWDESLSLYRAQQSVPYILSNRIDFPGISTTDQHPPLYFLLLHGFVRLCGESDLVLRFPSAAFATLIVPLLYVMGCRLRGRRTGLLAALFGALSPFYLWYAQEARMYTMLTALGLCALYALWRAVTEQRRSWGALFMLSAALAAATQYLYSLLLICLGILAIFLWPRNRRAKGEDPGRRRGGMLLGGAAILLLILVGLGHEGRGLIPSLGHYREYVPLGLILRDVLNSYSLGLSVNFREVWPLDLVFLAVFVIGIASIWAHPPRVTLRAQGSSLSQVRIAGLLATTGYILIPVVMIWVFSLVVPVYTNSRYAMMSSPAFYLALGLGLDALMRWRRWAAWVLLVALVASMGWSVFRYQYDERYQTKEDYRSIVEFITANERVGDLIIVNGPESLPAFLHYYCGDSPVVGLPEGGVKQTEMVAQLTEISASCDRIWFVRARTEVSDPKQVVHKWVDDHGLRLMEKGFPSCGFYLHLYSYLPRSPVQPEVAAGDSLGVYQDRLELLDYALRYVDREKRVREIPAAELLPAPTRGEVSSMEPVSAGKTISAELFWRPLEELVDFKTSLRLVRGSTVLAQRDRLPFMYFPVKDWPTGKTVRHEADLLIPYGTPPGDYTVQLWVYGAESGDPLTFRRDAAGEGTPYLTLGQIVVGKAATPARDLRNLRGLPDLGGFDRYRTGWHDRFGHRLELLDYRLEPQSVIPSEDMTLSLLWRARKAMREDMKLVLNWEDAGGRVWHTETYDLTGTGYPTSLWDEGEVVRGVLRLTVPPDAPLGVHSVHLLIYVPDRRAFLTLSKGPLPTLGRNLQIAEVTITDQE